MPDPTRRASRAALALCFVAALAVPLVAVRTARADGFHSKFLKQSRNPRDWWREHRNEFLPEARTRVQETGTRAEGRATELVRPPDENVRSTVIMILRHLLLLAPSNIVKSEFPLFQGPKAREYRQQFADILADLGRTVVPMVVDAYISGGENLPRTEGLRRCSDFKRHLVEILVRIGADSLDDVAFRLSHLTEPSARSSASTLLSELLRAFDASSITSEVSAALRDEDRRDALLELAEGGEEDAMKARLAFKVWMALIYTSDRERFVRYFGEKKNPLPLRSEMVPFLAEREGLRCADVLLRRVIDGEESPFLRKLCAWTLPPLKGEFRILSYVAPEDLLCMEAAAREKTLPLGVRMAFLAVLQELKMGSPGKCAAGIVNDPGEDEGVRLSMLALIASRKGMLKNLEDVRPSQVSDLDTPRELRFALVDFFSERHVRFATKPLVRAVIDPRAHPVYRLHCLRGLSKMGYTTYREAEKTVAGESDLAAALAGYVRDRKQPVESRIDVLQQLQEMERARQVALVAGFVGAFDAAALRKLAAEEPRVARGVFSLVARARSSTALKAALEVAADPGLPIAARLEAVRVLPQCRVDQPPPILDSLRDVDEPRLRVEVLIALQRFGKPISLGEIENCLKDVQGQAGAADVQAGLARILGRDGSAEAAKVLLSWLQNDPTREVSDAVLDEMASFGGGHPQLFEDLLDLYRKVDTADAGLAGAWARALMATGPTRDGFELLLRMSRSEALRIKSGSRAAFHGLHVLMVLFGREPKGELSAKFARSLVEAGERWFDENKEQMPK